MFEKNFRSKKILNFARDCPFCMACGKPSDDTIVAAHSNQLFDGKGTGLKAHDYRIAYLCSVCHFKVDQGDLSREEKKEIWETGHRGSIGWLFASGRLKVVEPSKYD